MPSPSPAPPVKVGSNTSAKAETNTTAVIAGGPVAAAPTFTAPMPPPSPLSSTRRGKKPVPVLAPHAREFSQELSPELRQRLHEWAAQLFQMGAIEIEVVVNAFCVVSTSGDENFELDGGHWLMVRVPGYTDYTHPARFQLKKE